MSIADVLAGVQASKPATRRHINKQAPSAFEQALAHAGGEHPPKRAADSRPESGHKLRSGQGTHASPAAQSLHTGAIAQAGNGLTGSAAMQAGAQLQIGVDVHSDAGASVDGLPDRALMPVDAERMARNALAPANDCMRMVSDVPDAPVPSDLAGTPAIPSETIAFRDVEGFLEIPDASAQAYGAGRIVGTLPVLFGGQLIELDLVRARAGAEHPRFVLKLPGGVRLEGAMRDGDLSIALAGNVPEDRETYENEARALAKRLGWIEREI